MTTEKGWILATRQAPGMRRVLEAVRRLDAELACWEDEDQKTTRPTEQECPEPSDERLLQ